MKDPNERPHWRKEILEVKYTGGAQGLAIRAKITLIDNTPHRVECCGFFLAESAKRGVSTCYHRIGERCRYHRVRFNPDFFAARSWSFNLSGKIRAVAPAFQNPCIDSSRVDMFVM